MQTFDDIRFYDAPEVNDAIMEYARHPMFKALLQFTFPEKSEEEITATLLSCRSIQDFQERVIYHSVGKVIEKSTEGFSTSGFEDLDRKQSYLYLSNHRDIILDTSFINFALMNHEQIMTASAIGDNLVKKSFLLVLSKLTRNFLVQRSLSLREMLASSKKLSLYIQTLIGQKQSIWMAQREGRTKDGYDRTQQGVLKMLAMNRGKEPAMVYLKKMRIVPVAISYEFDPTDIFKVPELIAKSEDVEYIKSSNEDFNSIMRGALGNKKRVHISLGTIENVVFERIDAKPISENDKLQELAQEIDRCIHSIYKLWPSNLVAYDLYHDSTKYVHAYTEKDKRAFERRIERRIPAETEVARESFLLMYANPVINKEKLAT
ncbi:MAG TPA: 1-acyl-sn-glycerol-3-phosphate acyltransferase [Leeuwenhoekiella sp.]|nr:1-acyl-sn-glycerol-3-phosphate acyltransferase [Leeuwenhoekiella sp.]